MIKYKIDILSKLKESGYNPQRLRNEKLIGEYAIQSLRHNKSVSFSVLDKICDLLECQPGDVIEHVKDSCNAE